MTDDERSKLIDDIATRMVEGMDNHDLSMYAWHGITTDLSSYTNEQLVTQLKDVE